MRSKAAVVGSQASSCWSQVGKRLLLTKASNISVMILLGRCIVYFSCLRTGKYSSVAFVTRLAAVRATG